MKKYIDRKILETLITKYGKSNINLAVNKLNENEFIYQATLCSDWFGSRNHCKLVNDRSTMDRWMGKKINDILKTGEVIDDGFSKTAAGPRPDRYEVYDIPKDGQYIKYGAYIIKYSKGNDIGNYYYIPNRIYDILEREFNRSSKTNDVNEMAYNYNILSDCPLTYNNQLDFKEYFIKRSKQEGYKFNKDIFYFDDIDCVDGKTSRDIPGVKANKTLNFDEAYNRLLKYFLNNLQEQVKMKRNNDRMLLESLVRKYGKNSIVKVINEMAHNKPYVTKDNVERIIRDLRNTYPEMHHSDIRAFFGGWQKGVWKFEPEWFDDIFTWEELVDAFDDWLNNEEY